ncbi:uncharacterized protein TNCV_2285711 [Trichonephila clavipes]|nr:uncharacterized protein TNCV_2285711 [Trichonephila clavipes]
MAITKTPVGFNYLQIENHKFELVDNFAYLGSNISILNDIRAEIKRRIIAANHCLHGQKVFCKSKRHAKITLYKAISRPLLTYGSETWMAKSQTEKLAIFERKVLRYILGSVNENGLWRQRRNFVCVCVCMCELYKLFKDADVIKSIKWVFKACEPHLAYGLLILDVQNFQLQAY